MKIFEIFFIALGVVLLLLNAYFFIEEVTSGEYIMALINLIGAAFCASGLLSMWKGLQ